MNKVIAVGIGAMIAIVTIAVMVPFTMEFGNEIHSMVPNEGGSYYDVMETDAEITLQFIEGIGYINDEKLPEIAGSYGSFMLMFGDSFVVRYSVNGTSFIFAHSGGSGSADKITFSDGTWTSTSGETTTTGTYGFMMRWVDKGTGKFTCFYNPVGKYVDSDAKVYVAQAALGSSGGGNGVWTGTMDNLTAIFSNNNETIPFSYTTSDYTTDPDVVEITEWTGADDSCLFIPSKYSFVSGTDSMTRTIVSLSPLFIGIMVFAAMGIYITRLNH